MPSGTAVRTEVAYVALGSNLGDRQGYLAAARTALASLPGTVVIAASDVEETTPLGPQDQPCYLNQMVALRTTLQPSELLDRLHAIERANGRVRAVRWGPRTLDLDIVRFGERHIVTPDLVIPHPELPHRAFWKRGLEQLRTRLPAAPTGARTIAGGGARAADHSTTDHRADG
jgi:2-amino-4-hydroxy-6-hydroxymethyldihydropteridine diphosphokinase